MKVLALGTALAIFSQLACTTPVANTATGVFGAHNVEVDKRSTELSKRHTWEVRVSSSTGCPASGATWGDNVGGCFVQGGNSIVASGPCRIVTYSGNNCRGSSFVVGPGCHNVAFASIQVTC